MNGKSREAVETNAKLDKLLLAVNEAYDTLVERKQPFDAEAVKNQFQGAMKTQTILLKLFDRHIEDVKLRIGLIVPQEPFPIIFTPGEPLPSLSARSLRLPALLSVS